MEQFTIQKTWISWRKLIKHATEWLLGILLVLGLFLWLSAEMKNYKVFKHDLADFQGARIGAPMAEVRYALGVPKHVIAPPSPVDHFPAPPQSFMLVYDVDATSGPNQMPPGKTAEQFDAWSWDGSGTARTDVTFDPKSRKVSEIKCFGGDTTKFPDCFTVGGLHSGVTEQEAVDALGPPDTNSYESVIKIMTWRAIGVHLYLTKRVVYAIDKSAPDGAGFWWWLTHGRP